MPVVGAAVGAAFCTGMYLCRGGQDVRERPAANDVDLASNAARER